MSEYIIPTVLTVEDVVGLPEDALKLMSQISTGIVLDIVNDFVKTNESSTDGNKKEAARKLRDAYVDVNNLNEYLTGSGAKDMVDKLQSLDYMDIRADVGLSVLQEYRTLIIQYLSEDESFREEYKGPIVQNENSGKMSSFYTKLDKDNFSSVLDELSSFEDPTTVSVVSRIKKNKNLFKSGARKVNKPTVFNRISYKKDKLRSLLKSIDYLIAKLESGQSPTTWRRL